ncbi:MAG: alpha-glucan family phosphorylase, partial [Maribacter sp.]|nr:alpha-glucan family phosphorylase [Maribacter sp.]
GENCFVFPEIDHNLPTWDQDKIDSDNLYDILENKVLPMYYDEPKKWQQIVFNGLDDVLPEFASNRMATQYYKEL